MFEKLKIEWKKILASLSLHTARYKSIFSFSEKLNEKICQAQNFCDGKLIFNDVENHFIIRKFFSHIASATQFATILKGKFGCNTWYVHYILALSFSVCTQCVLYTQSVLLCLYSVKNDHLTTLKCVCVSPHLNVDGTSDARGEANEMTKPNTNDIKIPKYWFRHLYRLPSLKHTHSPYFNNMMVSLTITVYSFSEQTKHHAKILLRHKHS